MHNGSLATLKDVVEHYDRGGVDRPSRSDLVKPLGLTAQEKSDLVAFLETLTSNMQPTTVPVLPR
jgi:cytochrome c peroxidase